MSSYREFARLPRPAHASNCYPRCGNCYRRRNAVTSSQRSAASAYMRIAQAIRNDIEAGRLRDGQRLPSTRELATQWKASQLTITKAMEQLAADGYISSKDRSGRVVTTPTALALTLAEPFRRPNHEPSTSAGMPVAESRSSHARSRARQAGRSWTRTPSRARSSSPHWKSSAPASMIASPTCTRTGSGPVSTKHSPLWSTTTSSAERQRLRRPRSCRSSTTRHGSITRWLVPP